MNIQEALVKSLKHHRNRIAIENGSQKLSYSELLLQADGITRFLLNLQLKDQTLVGINLDDKSKIVATMIGVMNARCAFVLLDHTLPDERLASIIETMKLEHVITRGDRWIDFRSPVFNVLRHHDLDDILAVDLTKATDIDYPQYDEDDSLYVYFTSGSTGVPKGIVGRNDSLLQFLNWEVEAFQVDENSRFSQFISPYFDAFLRDVFVPLMAGGTICIPPANEDFFSTDKLISWINQSEVTMIHCVPSLFRVFNTEALTASHFPELKYILMSGEKINPSELSNWFGVFGERIQLVNLYGTTETTMIRSCHLITPADAKRNRIPIGKPIAGTELLIANKELRPCNPLIPGDLYIVSNYITKGYLADEAQTNAKFLRIRKGTPDETWAFKTGDKARKLPGGLIELLGREDRQIKLRGIRIELDEIESVLMQSQYLKNVLVVADTSLGTEARLVAFVVKKAGTEIDNLKASLMKYMGEHLPAYMIPSDMQEVEEFPQLSNGKVDLKKLLTLLVPERELVAPASSTEEKVLEIWKQVLGDKPISVEDSFHHIGGNSLTIMNLISHINKVFGVRISLGELFKNTTIRSQAGFVDLTKGEGQTEIERAPKTDHYPLTSAQKRLYFLYNFDQQSLAYNMPQVVRVSGKLDKGRLSAALTKLVERHESLRTAFDMHGDQPVQRVLENVSIELEYAESNEEGATAHIQSFIRPFTLTTAPLFRAGLIKLPSAEYLLMVDVHHIVTDGVSQNLLVRDFMAIYHNEALQELKLSYTDYAVWRQSDEQQKLISDQRDFWKKQFSEGPSVLELPTDFKRPPVRSHKGAVYSFSLSEKKSQALKVLARKQGATMFMVLLSAFNLLLSRLSGKRQVTVGVPVTDRPHANLAGVAGIFVNTLVLRNDVDKCLVFNEFLAHIKSNALSCFDHKEYPYEELIEELNIVRNTSHNPLFDVVFDYQNFEQESLSIAGLDVEPYQGEQTISKFDLTLRAREKSEEIHFDFEYATSLYTEATVQRFAHYFKNILSQLSENSGMKLFEIALIDNEEKVALMAALDNANVSYPEEKTLVNLFTEQVDRTPENVAISFQGEELTYRELNARANQLANLLLVKGLKGNSIVGLLMDRSIETVIGMLGIIKAGGAYMPIDTDYPQQRIDYMIEDSGIDLLLTDKGQLNNLSKDLNIVFFEEASTQPVYVRGGISTKPADLCYIIYTSGTTGQPKGVMVEHRNVVRLFRNDGFRFEFGPADVWTMFHSHCFDFSVWEMYGALLFGARLVIIPKMMARDMSAYLRLLSTEKVTVLNQTPSAFYHLAHEAVKSQGAPLSLRYVIFGGEALSPAKLRPWYNKYPGVSLINMFGITETTVHVTYKEIGPEDIAKDISNIGKPIPTLTAYLLDEQLRLVPAGVVGELYVGGAGISRGYLGKEALTKERFIPNPFSKGTRLYKTGDHARLLASGDLEYRGRIDDQVQLRGFRVELGEIAYQLTNHSEVEEAVVLTRERGEDKALIAWYRSAGELDSSELRTHLSTGLPDYMVPDFFIRVNTFPLTPNGKLDKKRLPAPELKAGADYQAPTSETAQILVEIWSEVLHVNQDLISVNTSFFELGGNSLKLVRLNDMINERLGWQLSIADLFRFTTIETLCGYAQHGKEELAYTEEAEDEVMAMQNILDAFD